MNYMNGTPGFAAGQRQTAVTPAPVSDAAQILQVLDQASFAMDDVLLYLDTHPTDT